MKRLFIGAAILIATELTFASNEFYFDEIKALRPTPMAQSPDAAPGAVTIFQANEIRQLGIRNLPDLIQLVPGYTVTKYYDDNTVVANHGSESVFPRGIMVRIDGVTVSSPIFPIAIYNNLPVSFDEIERVEFYRSPAASFGSDAFSVINIITKSALHRREATAKLESGSNDLYIQSGSLYYNYKNIGIHLFASDGQRDGRDTDYKIASPFDSYQGKHVDNYDDRYFNAMLELSLDDGSKIVYSGRTNNADTDFANDTPTSLPLIRTSDNQYNQHSLEYTFSSSNHDVRSAISYIHNEGQYGTYGNYPNYRFSPAGKVWNSKNYNNLWYAVIDTHFRGPNDRLRPLVMSQFPLIMMNPGSSYGSIDYSQNNTQTTLELEDTIKVNDDAKLLLGVRNQKNELESEYLISGEDFTELYQLYTHAEITPAKNWIINLGALGESIHSEKNIADNTNLAKRASVSYLLNSRNTLKVGYAKTYSLPSLSITSESLDPYITLDEPFNGSTDYPYWLTNRVDEPINTEKLDTYEIIWTFNNYTSNYRSELRMFKDYLDDLNSMSHLGIFNPDGFNMHSAKYKGVEHEFRIKPANDLTLGAAITYLDADASFYYETFGNQDHRWVTGVFGIYQLTQRLSTSFKVHSETDAISPAYSQYEARVEYVLPINNHDVIFSYKATKFSDREDAYYMDPYNTTPGVDIAQTSFDNSLINLLSLEVKFK